MVVVPWTGIPAYACVGGGGVVESGGGFGWWICVGSRGLVVHRACLCAVWVKYRLIQHPPGSSSTHTERENCDAELRVQTLARDSSVYCVQSSNTSSVTAASVVFRVQTLRP